MSNTLTTLPPGSPPPPPTKLTVEQYHAMIAHGILEEGSPIELLDGYLVSKDRSASGEDPITVGPAHALVVTLLGEFGPDFIRHGCHIRLQQPVSIPPVDEPEPDAAIVRGLARDFTDQPPTASDILAVIEVSDSSLQRDRTYKLGIYARASMPLYIIINLQESLIEYYTQPIAKFGRFGRSETFTIKQTILLPTAGKPLKMQAKHLLP